MNKRYIFLVLVLVMIGGGFFVVDYFHLCCANELEPGEIVVMNQAAEISADEQEESIFVQYNAELFTENLYVPWSMIFTTQNRMLVSERRGQIMAVINGVLQEEPLHVFPEVSSIAEEGLMGLALDPEYQNNQLLYACLAYDAGDTLQVRVIRLKDRGNIIDRDGIVIDNIPAARFHAGCRLGFGPDEKLYITTGDATDRDIAQDLNSLGGKILRVNTDGSVPDDNPFQDSYVYSFGHRNAQGIDWHPVSGVLLSTEHGPSIFDGPAGGDEVNNIIAGGNYGWPLVSHDENQEGLIAPLIQFTPATAPASAMVYTGAVFPQWQGDLFYGGLRGEGLYRVSFTNDQAVAVKEVQRLSQEFGRIRDVIEGPDGLIYFTTSNRDGRGDVRLGDDKIYRLIPASE